MGYTVTFMNKTEQDIDAERYERDGEWFEFYNVKTGGVHEQVANLRASLIERIDKK